MSTLTVATPKPFARTFPASRISRPVSTSACRRSRAPVTGARRHRGRTRKCPTSGRGRRNKAASSPKTSEAREQGGGAGQSGARSVVRRRQRSCRPDDPHPQPAVPGGGRAVEEGTGVVRRRSGRHDHRAVHDRAEAADRQDFLREITVQADPASISRNGRSKFRRCCASVTAFRRAATTTFSCARSTRWPAC